MAILQSTTISGSLDNTGSLAVSGSTIIFPFIESSLTSSFSGSGKMWINADTQNLQYSIQTSLGTVQSPASFMGAWSAGGNIINARRNYASAGTQNAALVAGGFISPSAINTTCTEEYNGSIWSTGGTLINGRHYSEGTGTQDAALAIGGLSPSQRAQTEEYNGTSWASGGNLINARSGMGTGGFQNSAVVAGGWNPTATTVTEEYNGSSWSAGGALPSSRYNMSSGGTQNALLTFLGTQNGTPSMLNVSQQYDGTSWSDTNSLSCARYVAAGSGTTNAALAFGGANPTDTNNTEEYNGVSWVTSCSMTTARSQGDNNNVGSQTSALAISGFIGPASTAVTEEYTKNFISPYTTNVWTKGAAVITARGEAAGTGTQNAGLFFGGVTPK